MIEFEKIECSCADAYTARKLRDPNCCAHSCDYNDAVDRIAELEREKAELLVQVEAFKMELNKAVVNGVPLLRVNQALKSLVAATPTQCLNQIKAEAVQEFAKAVLDTGEISFEDSRFIRDFAIEHSASIAKGE